MSGECSFFNFCLRGSDSLVSKWISQKRKISGTLKTDGANIYAISEYIHTVFCFDKLYGSDYTSNVLFNKIIEINDFDKNHIVKFDEIIMIPFDFSIYEFSETSFDDMAKDVSGMDLSAAKLGSVLSDSEIKELLINIYHINYDLRKNEKIKNKSYDEIISGKFIDFQGKIALSFFIPYIFEIPAKKAVESSESPVQTILTVSSIQPEVSKIYVEGYFYTKDGEYAGKNGTSEKCYAVSGIKKNYNTSDVKDLNIMHDNFTETCNYIFHEAQGNKTECLWIAHTTNNAKSVKDVSGKHSTMLEQFCNNGYSSAITKVAGTGLADTDFTDKAKNSRYAVIDVLLGNSDPTGNAVLWDGTDFLTKGKKQNKFKEYKKITISYQILKAYDDSIPYTRDSVFNDSIKNKTDFIESGSGKYYSIIATGTKGQSIFWKLGR
ncbi:MAG: hypothetical protein ACI4PR_05650 [Acutalibacteraceae bacterium]